MKIGAAEPTTIDVPVTDVPEQDGTYTVGPLACQEGDVIAGQLVNVDDVGKVSEVPSTFEGVIDMEAPVTPGAVRMMVLPDEVPEPVVEEPVA